ncbi:PTS sugar transporter subunit IIA [Alkalihalobacillus sp. FSL R5-0424]
MLLKDNQIFLNIELGNRDDVLHLISQKAQELGITDDQEQLLADLISRETTYSTAFQEGIAIPHAKSAAVNRAALIFIKMKEKIDWQSPDQFKVENIFAILVPNVEAGTRHLQILSALAGQLMEEEFQERLATIQSKDDVLELLNSVEREVV